MELTPGGFAKLSAAEAPRGVAARVLLGMGMSSVPLSVPCRARRGLEDWQVPPGSGATPGMREPEE